MTYEFEYLMHLFSCGARGTIPEPPSQPVDYDRLIQLAQEQSVLPLVGAALINKSDIGFPEEKRKKLLDITRSMALTNYLRRRQILDLLPDFEQAGIQAVLLKGYAIADLYAAPDCRISSDTDIYVSIKDEKRAHQLLRDHGCKVNPRPPLSHHAVCEHQQMGCIELHVSLYDDTAKNVWFGKVNNQKLLQEAYERHEFPDGSCTLLGKTDNLIFLTLHMIKHFIHSGISLRQMMDIALYLKIYRNQIDVKRFWTTLVSLKYDKVVSTVLSVLVSFCGFSPDNFIHFQRADNTAVSALLSDLESGGWLGIIKEEERKDVRYRYNRSRYMENKNAFIFWMFKRNIIRCFHAVIPSMPMLENKNPHIKKAKALVPFVWVQLVLSGILRLLLGRLHTGIAPHSDKVSDKQEDRFQLFKLMQMM